jgi:uracil phosphoribosyltransferase
MAVVKFLGLAAKLTKNQAKRSHHPEAFTILSNNNRIHVVHNFSKTPSITNDYLLQLRDEELQLHPVMFRMNLKRLGQIMGYEISKKLQYENVSTATPLGVAECQKLSDKIVLGTILRAGIPMHEGLLSVFENAENAFVSAYRKHHKDGTFEISLEYISSPDIDGKVLILCDPMLATGSSMVKTLNALIAEYGTPKEIHIVTVVASTAGLEYVSIEYPNAFIWICAEDEELTAKSYIVPGLGDAGDLAYGQKSSDATD